MISRLSKACCTLFVLAGSLVIAAQALAQNPVAESQVHRRDADAAYRAGDFDAFTNSLELAYQLNPASVATRYNLACGYARTGQTEKAMALLRELVDARIDFGMTNDPDLETLQALPEFEDLSRQLAANLEPIVRSESFLTVDQLGLIPEGIAYDAATGRFFFGSMRSGDVYVIDADKQLAHFASVDTSGRLAAIGMTVDTRRELLWVVGTSFEMAENFSPDDDTVSGVFGFDLASGELKRKHLIENADLGLNDVTLGPDGTLYASGGVLHVLADDKQLVPLETTPALYGSNGVSVSPDGRTLYVSSYPVGLAAIDVRSGALQFLNAPGNTSLYGIDGLYWHDGALIAVQNGIRPWRLLRIELNDERNAIVKTENIEFAVSATTATTGAIVGDRIHYIGQGPDPDPVPTHFPTALAPFMGKTLIRTAPLRP